MQKKFILGLIASLFIIVHIMNKNPDRFKTSKYQKATFSFANSAPNKLLLNPNETTQKVSTPFINTDNFHFANAAEYETAISFFRPEVNLPYVSDPAGDYHSYTKAASLIPNSFMPHWGQAFILRPNINDPLNNENRKNQIKEAVAKAKKLLSNASPKEQALIEALNTKYCQDFNKDVAQLNMEYMFAMSKVAQQFPKDDNIQILFAASIINTIPWNY